MIETVVQKNTYMDSIFLMNASRALMELDGVGNAVVVMGSDMNKTVLREFGGLTAEAAAASANDLIISLDLERPELLETAQAKLRELLAHQEGGASAGREYRTQALAAQAAPEANLVIVSVPGEYAAREAREALEHGRSVLLFSDNVPLEEEVALKALARERRLLAMGPGCGNSILQGVSLGMISKVRRGRVGIVGASGSGIHEIAALVHAAGEGISQAIGTGGRDLSLEVEGATMLQGIEYLSADPETEVLVLVSKPPHPETARKIYAALPRDKPVVIDFLGGDPEEIEAAGACAAATLEEAAALAVGLARGLPPERRDAVGACRAELWSLAEKARASLAPGQVFLRGLFCGGTHSEEAVLLLRDRVRELHSNIAFGGALPLADAHRSQGNTLVDMGDEEFTKGRPHPVMDPVILCDRMVREAADPQTAVLLFDVLLGFGIHGDPVGALRPALREIRARGVAEGWHTQLVASLCGTDLDPQDLDGQRRQLEELGVTVLPSNARAALFAGMLVER